MTSIFTELQTPIVLAQHVYHHIIACARGGKPHEVCGVVRGRGKYGFEAIQGRNVAGETTQNYELDVQTLLLKYAFEKSGDELIGVYHSHPISEAYPSSMDAWNAFYPELVYFICSLEDDSNPILRAFSMDMYPVSIGDYDIAMKGRIAYQSEHIAEPRVLQLNIRGLVVHLREIRPASHAFGSYQTINDDIALLFADIIKQATSFYLLCSCENSLIADVRIVAIREHAVQLV